MATSDDFYLALIPTIEETLATYGTMYTVRGPAVHNKTTMKSTPGPTREVAGVTVDSATKNNLATQIYPINESSQGWFKTRGLILEPGAVPKAEEEIQVDGKWFPLGNAQEVKPADIVLLYLVDVSK